MPITAFNIMNGAKMIEIPWYFVNIIKYPWLPIFQYIYVGIALIVIGNIIKI